MSDFQDPVKPSKTDPYAAPAGVPVAAPNNNYPNPNPSAPTYAPGQVPYAAPGQPAQVDAYGRPVVNAIPVQPARVVVNNNASIRRDAQGNALCKKCGAPYPLPPNCTSWRCQTCQTLNNASIYGDEWCSIL